MIEEAYEEACKTQPAGKGQLQHDSGNPTTVVTGDRAALKRALAEVFLNALQANEADPRTTVRWQVEANGKGLRVLQLEVQDNGAGFTPEATKRAFEPFFKTRTVGVGLGLTVAHKIIETHRGKVEIVAPKCGQGGVVRISIPLAASPTAQT